MFEHNFGDSEFLMLFLLLVTLPVRGASDARHPNRRTPDPNGQATRVTDLAKLLKRLVDRPILVLGDVMLDHFIVGGVDRISPEAPVPVVRFAREEYRLGGAANVANNLRSLGADVELVALIGQDGEADRVRSGADADPRRRDRAGRRSVALHDPQDARRHQPQSAGRAHRLRRGRRSLGASWKTPWSLRSSGWPAPHRPS